MRLYPKFAIIDCGRWHPQCRARLSRTHVALIHIQHAILSWRKNLKYHVGINGEVADSEVQHHPREPPNKIAGFGRCKACQSYDDEERN